MSPALDPALADEVQTALSDMCSSRDGLAALVHMLKGSGPQQPLLDLGNSGLAALLDGLRTRLDLACDGLTGAALQLGVAVN